MDQICWRSINTLEVGPEPVGVETLSHPHDGGWVALAMYFLLRGTIFDFTGTGLNFADTGLARIIFWQRVWRYKLSKRQDAERKRTREPHEMYLIVWTTTTIWIGNIIILRDRELWNINTPCGNPAWLCMGMDHLMRAPWLMKNYGRSMWARMLGHELKQPCTQDLQVWTIIWIQIFFPTSKKRINKRWGGGQKRRVWQLVINR
jgi:hypothetical protein